MIDARGGCGVKFIKTDDRFLMLDASKKNGITLLKPGETVASQMKKLFLSEFDTPVHLTINGAGSVK